MRRGRGGTEPCPSVWSACVSRKTNLRGVMNPLASHASFKYHLRGVSGIQLGPRRWQAQDRVEPLGQSHQHPAPVIGGGHTFTATTLPSRVTALYTCARLAAATGSSEISRNTAPRGLPPGSRRHGGGKSHEPIQPRRWMLATCRDVRVGLLVHIFFF